MALTSHSLLLLPVMKLTMCRAAVGAAIVEFGLWSLFVDLKVVLVLSRLFLLKVVISGDTS